MYTGWCCNSFPSSIHRCGARCGALIHQLQLPVPSAAADDVDVAAADAVDIVVVAADIVVAAAAGEVVVAADDVDIDVQIHEIYDFEQLVPNLLSKSWDPEQGLFLEEVMSFEYFFPEP